MKLTRNVRTMARWVVAGLLLLALAPAPASAEPRVGLTVACEHEGVPLEGLELLAYRAGEADGAGEPELSGAFAGYGVAFDPEDIGTWKGAAEALAAYARRDALPPAASAVADGSGSARLDLSRSGLYLVAGSRYEGGGISFDPEPFLIALPQQTASGPRYQVEAELKGEAVENPSEPASVKVLKVWKDAGPGEAVPAGVDVQLLCDGRVHDTVTLTEDGGWRHVWDGLDPSRSWSVVEAAVPEGYVLSIGRQGGAFLLANRATSPGGGAGRPADVRLPRTGDAAWPIAALVGGAAACYALAAALRNRGDRGRGR